MQAESPVSDVPVQMGGKKQKNNKNKGGAYGVENVLAPAVLYGLRRLATPGGKRNKQRGGDAFSSQAAPVGESTGPLLAVVPVVPPAGVAVVPPTVEQVAPPVDKPQEAGPAATDSGDKSLAGGAKKSKKGKKGGDKKEDNNQQDGGKKKRKGGDKKDNKNNNNDDNQQQDGGKKKRNNKRKGGDKKDDKKDNNNNDDNNQQQDGGKKKNKRSKKVKGGALDLYAQQLEQISNSLNKLLFN